MKKLAVVGFIIILLILLMAILGPVISPYPPSAINLSEGLKGPSPAHPFGQDKLGRDIFTMVAYGARVSLIVSLTAVLISAFTGIFIGGISGYAGGIVDEIIMRIVDILLAFPGILLAIALAAILGPSMKNIIIALSVMGWVGYARLVRGEVLSLKEREYVLSAISQGFPWWRIIFIHIIPETLPPVIVQATFGMAGTILAEASLSFLGLGPQDTPSWGKIISDGIEYLRLAPHISIFPGIMIMLTVMAFNFIGDWLREKIEPDRGG